MNTNSAMRTVLAAAAAGALVLGSAGAATAEPGKAKGPKARTQVSDTVTLKSVSIKGHRYIDLAKADEATALKLRAKVRHRVKADSDDAASIKVTLGVYTKKVGGEMVEGTVASAAATLMPVEKKNKKNHYFKGDAVLLDVWSADDVGALRALLKPGDKAYVCIATADADGFVIDKYSTQVKKRLGYKSPGGAEYTKRIVRDCVKVVDSSTTE